MKPLTITNSQAPVHDFLVEGIARYLSGETGLEMKLVTNGSWSEREALLDAGEIDAGWICGAAYVQKRERGIYLSPFAAPVMKHARYEGRPIYFSEVLVRKDSTIHAFEDLQGKRWAYNEPGSVSGYHIVRYALAMRGLNGNFFGQVIESGAHQNSVGLLLEKNTDVCAIDSTVWEMLRRNDPGLDQSIRIVETLGPTPMPPIVIGEHIAPDVREMLASALTRMTNSVEANAILQRAGMTRLTRITDRDYDPIRSILQIVR